MNTNELSVEQMANMCIEIAHYYGFENQISKSIEELAELIRALATGTSDEVVEEIADVEIMIYQLKYLYGIETAVGDAIEYKLKRQMKRIERREPAGTEKIKAMTDCMWE